MNTKCLAEMKDLKYIWTIHKRKHIQNQTSFREQEFKHMTHVSAQECW